MLFFLLLTYNCFLNLLWVIDIGIFVEHLACKQLHNRRHCFEEKGIFRFAHKTFEVSLDLQTKYSGQYCYHTEVEESSSWWTELPRQVRHRQKRFLFCSQQLMPSRFTTQYFVLNTDVANESSGIPIITIVFYGKSCLSGSWMWYFTSKSLRLKSKPFCQSAPHARLCWRNKDFFTQGSGLEIPPVSHVYHALVL